MKCPLCGKTNFKIILNKDCLDKYYSLTKCNHCKLVFVNPLPTQKELEEYYNSEYSVPEYQKIKVIKKAKIILNLLKKFGLKKGSKILEIGASHGFFLNEIKKRNFIPYGVEISKEACEYAKKQFNIDIENKDFLESKYVNKKEFFDVVVLLDVLEHLINQNETLENIYKVLKRKGFLVLTIPNINSLEFKLCGRYWRWLSPPAHLFYYSPTTIKKMLEKHNFKVIYLETFQGDSAGNLLFQIYLSLEQFFFYSLKYVIGRKKLLKIRENIRKNLKNKTIKNMKEFVGIDEIIYKITNLLWKPFIFIDNLRFKKRMGPSILVIAVKK